MNKTKFIYWQEEDMFLGYLDEFPDYMTQGESLEELKENLEDIYHEVTKGVMIISAMQIESRIDKGFNGFHGLKKMSAICVIG